MNIVDSDMFEKDIEQQWLELIETNYQRIDNLDKFYLNKKNILKGELAERIDEAIKNSDLTVKSIGQHFGITRQAVNKILVNHFGIRHTEKSESAKIGHINKD